MVRSSSKVVVFTWPADEKNVVCEPEIGKFGVTVVLTAWLSLFHFSDGGFVS